MRSDYGTRAADAEVVKIRKELESIYRQAANNIDKKMESFNNRFAANDAKYRALVDNGKMTEREYKDWLSGQVFQGKQWEAKQKQIAEVLANSNRAALDIVNTHSFNVFAANANYQTFLLEKGAKINTGFGLYNSASVARLVRDNPEILPMKKLNKAKDKAWNMRKMRSSITQGILQGESIDKVAHRLARDVGSTNMKSMMTHARTAMTGAQNGGRLESLMEAEELGIETYKEWMATLDDHTRDSHAELDGERVPVDEEFSNKLMFPGDPNGDPEEVYNCRCTMVGGALEGIFGMYDSDYQRLDNINGTPIENVTYREWLGFKEAGGGVPLEFSQIGIASCRTVDDVNRLLNSNDLWRISKRSGKPLSQADLTGCDLDSAKSVASAYERIFDKYPQLKGRIDAPDAQPNGMGDRTYAWCQLFSGKVQVNPSDAYYGNWASISRRYEKDVISGWHPRGTTAEAIVTHELGHAVDSLLAREGILGGMTASGEYRYASSSLKSTIMKRASKKDPVIGGIFEVWGTGKDGMSFAVGDHVSRYATKNNKEWFAECFAEYITSAKPRPVAAEFGKELEKLLRRLK